MGTWQAVRLLLAFEFIRARNQVRVFAKVVAWVSAFVVLLSFGGAVFALWSGTGPPTRAQPVPAAAPALTVEEPRCVVLVTDPLDRFRGVDLLDHPPIGVCDTVIEVPGELTPLDAVQRGMVRAWIALDDQTLADGTTRVTVTHPLPELWQTWVEGWVRDRVRDRALVGAGAADPAARVAPGLTLWMSATTGAVEPIEAYLPKVALNGLAVIGALLGLAVPAFVSGAGGATADLLRLSARLSARWLALAVASGARVLALAGVMALAGACWVGAVGGTVSMASGRGLVTEGYRAFEAAGWGFRSFGVVTGVMCLSTMWLAPVFAYGVGIGRARFAVLALAGWGLGSAAGALAGVDTLTHGAFRAVPFMGLVLATQGAARTGEVLFWLPPATSTFGLCVTWSALAFVLERRSLAGAER